MALGDLMASRFSHSLVVVSNHLEECSSHEDVDSFGQTRDRDSETATSSYGNAGALTVTSMAYLPQTVVMCEPRHEAFEDSMPSGPSDSGLVSKWRPKDRIWADFFTQTAFLFPDYTFPMPAFTHYSEIKGTDGKSVYIEYEYGYPEDVKEGISIGHPTYETVLREGSGEFIYYLGDHRKSWLFGWCIRPGYCASGRCIDDDEEGEGEDDDEDELDDDDDDYYIANPFILGEKE